MPGKYVIYFIVSVLACFGCAKLLAPDNPIEEHTEKQLEKTIESFLGLNEGAMDGQIDLSPNSTEK